MSSFYSFDKFIDARIDSAKKILHSKIEWRAEQIFDELFSRIRFAEQRLRCEQAKLTFSFSPTYEKTILALNNIPGICDAVWINTSMVHVYTYNYRFKILRDELLSDIRQFLGRYMPLRVQWAVRETHDHNGNDVLLITFKI